MAFSAPPVSSQMVATHYPLCSAALSPIIAGPSSHSQGVFFSSATLWSNNEKWRSRASIFPSFLKMGKSAKQLKEELLQVIEPLDCGAEATPNDQQRVNQIVRKLETVNPTKQPAKSDLINGKWEVIYTTSPQVLNIKRPKFLRSRVNYQAFNTDTGRAQNLESWPFYNQATANLETVSGRKLAWVYDAYKLLNLISVKIPGVGRSEIEITFLDDELRICKGGLGNLFIFKMVDPSYRVPL